MIAQQFRDFQLQKQFIYFLKHYQLEKSFNLQTKRENHEKARLFLIKTIFNSLKLKIIDKRKTRLIKELLID